MRRPQKLALLSNPQLFEKLDPEALFFSFYYQPGSFQQYLAARELKRQCWRYHKQHSAWFQVRARGRLGARGLAAERRLRSPELRTEVAALGGLQPRWVVPGTECPRFPVS